MASEIIYLGFHPNPNYLEILMEKAKKSVRHIFMSYVQGLILRAA